MWPSKLSSITSELKEAGAVVMGESYVCSLGAAGSAVTLTRRHLWLLHLLRGLFSKAHSSRSVLASALEGLDLPTTSEEIWRYAPLRDLDLEALGARRAPSHVESIEEIVSQADVVVRMVDGVPG
jgi:hypothetical protein